MAAPTHLPMDITTEILSRLPVKSLMRFKCVSISFYNLISNDPLFRKKHLYHQSNFTKVILVPHNFETFRWNSVYPCPLLSFPPEGGVREGTIYLKLPAPDSILRQVRFHNSCDGLFCFSMSGGDRAIIWNPTTRQASTFRFQGCSTLGRPSWIGYSLAHDSRSDIYKLLALCMYGYNTYRLFFYSTEEMGTWRYIEDSSCACDYVKYDGKPTIVNGAFHWLGSSEKDFRMPLVVVSLDISDETYGSLALPQAIFDDNSRGPTLTLYELKGKLCIFRLGVCCDLWVMNEYGAVDSMIRMFRISCLQGIFWPFHMLENDTLVIYSSGQIYFYKDGRVLPNTKDPYAYLKMDPYVYFESLISPHTCLQGANNLTSRGKHVAEKRWQKSCLQRLCFCKSF